MPGGYVSPEERCRQMQVEHDRKEPEEAELCEECDEPRGTCSHIQPDDQFGVGA